MIRPNQAISFYSDYSHRQFVMDNSLSYPDMEVWFPLIEDSYGILSLAQAVVHSSNLYLNVAPAVQAACESRLLESGAMSNYTISFLHMLHSSPNVYFNSIYVKWDHLASIDPNTVQTILREELHHSMLEPGEIGVTYKEVFLYVHNSQVRMGFSIICALNNSCRVTYFDSAGVHNFMYKLYDFMNGRYYPTNILVPGGFVDMLPVYLDYL